MLGRRHPAHARRRSDAEDQLQSLGHRIAPLDPAVVQALAHQRAHRVVPRALWAAAAAVVIGLVAFQWFRPLPRPVFRTDTVGSMDLAGAASSMPGPSTGSAALYLAGAGSLGRWGSASPVPVASLAKVLAAYVVVHDHPVPSGGQGPELVVPASVVSAYQTGEAAGQSEVAVALGEHLSEMQALEGLLVGGANDMATLVADWDAGSLPAFAARMNSTARSLGLDSTTITDPSGLDPTTVSTPTDLVRLGEVAMAVPTLSGIVAMPQVTLPLAGTVSNLDTELGSDGFVGIKTGNDTASGGCFLFEARQSVAGRTLTLVGVVLGQSAALPTSAALAAADALVRRAFSSAGPVPVTSPGQVVGTIVAPWGASAPVAAATAPPAAVAWPGLRVPVTARVMAASSGAPSGTRVGVLDVDLGAQHVDVVLHTAKALPGPSAMWRLTRL